jgi:hypothetical protein
MSQVVKLKCSKCQSEFSTEAPESVIMNSPKVCVVAAAPKTIVCPNPGCAFVMTAIIEAAQVRYRWVNLPVKEQPAIVVP